MPGKKIPSPANEACLVKPRVDHVHDDRPFLDVSLDSGVNWSRVLQVSFVVSSYILISACLISLNKFLMRSDVFPFPVTLVLVHSGFNVILAAALYAAFPSLFGSVQALEKSDQVEARQKLFKKALPIGALFTLELVFGNAAYMHSSIPFLQMMKESAVVWVYVLSLLVSLEEPTWRKSGIVTAVLLATVMTIRGEANFDLTGFLLQGASLSCSCLKTVLQSLLLSESSQTKLDAPSYVLVVMPICWSLLSSCCLLTWLVPGTPLVWPTWDLISRWANYIILSAFLAAGLNFAIAMLIRYTSAMGFVLTGIVKDSAIVFWGWLLLGEGMTSYQFAGFGVQMCCVASWASLKISQSNENADPACQRALASPKLLQEDTEYGAVNSK